MVTGKRKPAGPAGDLLDFDRSGLKREDCVVTWKCLAAEVGVSADTLQRWFAVHKITLPRWGPHGNSPAFLPRVKIAVLRELYFR